MQQVDKWIEEIVKGKTFADVGGLWGTFNEKVTVAARAGAAETVMIDITPLDTELWGRFEERCSAENVSDYKCLQADINDPSIVSKVGAYDVVHCSGVLYHCPHPLYTVMQLSKICNESLILVSTVIPQAFSNSHGRVVLEPGSALFVPALNELQRAVIDQYFKEVGVQGMGGINEPCDWTIDNDPNGAYAPWWWLFTTEHLLAILRAAGFKVSGTAFEWHGRNALYLAEKAARTNLSEESVRRQKMKENRYADDWNNYSEMWDAQFGKQYTHLGDEWNDDDTADRKRDSFYFNAYAERFIGSDMTVLEVGPGGGKWTVRIAPKVKHLIVSDVAKEMLERTEARCKSLGITNVEYVLSNGKDFQPVADKSIDFFFSYDVFVHIALEDIWPYTQEIARVLVSGGRGACHYAINSIPEAWDRIEQNNAWYRSGKHTLGQYYYFSPEVLRRMYERCGLRIAEQHQEAWNFVCVFEKPAVDVVSNLEELLKQLISEEANDDQVRAEIVAALQSLPGQLEQRLNPLLLRAQEEKDLYRRVHYGAEIRRTWRGM